MERPHDPNDKSCDCWTCFNARLAACPARTPEELASERTAERSYQASAAENEYRRQTRAS